MKEIEVKIEVENADGARALLDDSGASAETSRYFEDNRVYDDSGRSLSSSGRLLRLRSIGDRHILTAKLPPTDEPLDSKYKIRTEHECSVDDADRCAAILEGIGFRPVYRYQKYRQRFRLDTIHVELDETPIGVFLELEGDPDGIDRVAHRLGFDPSSYIVASYRELHEERAGSAEPGDLVFPGESPA